MNGSPLIAKKPSLHTVRSDEACVLSKGGESDEKESLSWFFVDVLLWGRGNKLLHHKRWSIFPFKRLSFEGREGKVRE